MSHPKPTQIAQPTQTAPRCGRDFLALLSTGEFVVMNYPKRATGWHDYWNTHSVRVPVADTLGVDAREDFIQLVKWYELPEVNDKAAVGVMRDAKFGGGCYVGDI